MKARLAAALACTVLLAGCASGSPGPELVVFAAASLNQTFTQLGAQFEATHPGVTVRFSFEGSATLVDQLSSGAPADVLATADEQSMDRASSAGLIGGTAQAFASNVLTLIVPAGNPAHITGLDSSLDDALLVVCAEAVPCGAATKKLAAALGVKLRPVSEESKVTDVRTKVESGQADAGIVYVTDARAAQNVDAIAIAGADKVRNVYLTGVPTTAGQPALGAEFIELVRGSRGQEVLAAAGFGSG